MKTAKRIILIWLLAVLLLGAFLLNPLIRFCVYLEKEQFSDAEAIYQNQLMPIERFQKEASRQLKAYTERQTDAYYARKKTFDAIKGILNALSETKLPQADIDLCIAAVDRMEQARIDLAHADSCFAEGDYVRAIPYFRQSLIADKSASSRLIQAEAIYKEQILGAAEAAMNDGQFVSAENILTDGQAVLGEDADLSAALADARRLETDRIYSAIDEEAHQRLVENGPAAAFQYMADLRRQTPEEFRLEYLEQSLRHEYEENVCSRAMALRDAGDALEACSVLAESFFWIDSVKIKTLYTQIRASIPFYLCDMPVFKDETADAETGAQSTVARDQILSDSLSNLYTHSFWADMGSISFSLDGSFDVFAGTVAFPLGEKADIYRASATLQIFGDGRLIAEFRDIDSSSAPLPFSIPVKGVQELCLTWTSNGANGWANWGRFATIFDGRLLTESAVDANGRPPN